MEKYDVETRPEALKDLDEIVDSLSDDSVQSAIRHHDLIVEKISGLSEMPRRFPLARDIQLRARDFRTMYVKKLCCDLHNKGQQSYNSQNFVRKKPIRETFNKTRGQIK
jgi:plasmid stabilization system protein ParE